MALHNGPQNFGDLKEYFDGHPISQLSDEVFANKISQLIDSSKFLLQGGIKLNRGEDILSKLDAILLILKLSIAAENLPVGDKKRDSIQLLQKETIEEIINSIKNINENSQRWCNPENFQGLDGVQYRSAHQRLLMINSLLFYYAQTLHKNEKIENFFKHFVHFNLKIEKAILDVSRRQAVTHRMSDSSGSSHTEKQMISQFIDDRFYGKVSQFASSKEGPEEIFIDSDSGLELDFPLKNKITIEFDGPSHFIQTGQETFFATLDHLRKERQLLENDWIRISLSIALLKKYKQSMRNLTTAVTATLNSAPVQKYIGMHQDLSSLKNTLRTQIKALHDKLKTETGVVPVSQGVALKTSGLSQKERKQQQKGALLFSANSSNSPASVDAKSALSKELSRLLTLENQISTFLGKNYLDKTINADTLRTNIDLRFRLANETRALEEKGFTLASKIGQKIHEISVLQRKLKGNYHNNPDWRKLQGDINSKKKQQETLNKEIRENTRKIGETEQQFDSLLHEELHLGEFSCLISEVSGLIQPSGEKEERVDAQISFVAESEERGRASVRATS